MPLPFLCVSLLLSVGFLSSLKEAGQGQEEEGLVEQEVPLVEINWMMMAKMTCITRSVLIIVMGNLGTMLVYY